MHVNIHFVKVEKISKLLTHSFDYAKRVIFASFCRMFVLALIKFHLSKPFLHTLNLSKYLPFCAFRSHIVHIPIWKCERKRKNIWYPKHKVDIYYMLFQNNFVTQKVLFTCFFFAPTPCDDGEKSIPQDQPWYFRGERWKLWKHFYIVNCQKVNSSPCFPRSSLSIRNRQREWRNVSSAFDMSFPLRNEKEKEKKDFLCSFPISQ